LLFSVLGAVDAAAGTRIDALRSPHCNPWATIEEQIGEVEKATAA
jgi:hypothetical protein